jgi:hypothetical protein
MCTLAFYHASLFTYCLQINLFQNNWCQTLNNVFIMMHETESRAVWAFYQLGVPNWNRTTENQLDIRPN